VQHPQGKILCRYEGKSAADRYIPDSVPAGKYLLRGKVDGKDIRRSLILMR